MIYNLYESGLCMQAIRNELIRAGRKAGNGKVSWDTTKIMRVLRNTIYKGVMGYKKSQRNNFLDQKTIINRDESTYMYVKGNSSRSFRKSNGNIADKSERVAQECAL